MKRVSLLCYSVVFLVFMMSCSSQNGAELIGGEYNEEVWKNDEQGCKNTRWAMLDDIKKAKEKLLQMGEKDIRQTFGKPDKVSLFTRSQKFYLYYLESGRQCTQDSTHKMGRSLEISLDALGRLHEMNVRN